MASSGRSAITRSWSEPEVTEKFYLLTNRVPISSIRIYKAATHHLKYYRLGLLKYYSSIIAYFLWALCLKENFSRHGFSFFSFWNSRRKRPKERNRPSASSGHTIASGGCVSASRGLLLAYLHKTRLVQWGLVQPKQPVPPPQMPQILQIRMRLRLRLRLAGVVGLVLVVRVGQQSSPQRNVTGIGVHRGCSVWACSMCSLNA